MDVVTFGELMVLLLAEPGVPVGEATAFRRTVAGSEGNVAIGLARQGYDVGWFGRVGADPFGDAVVRTVRGEGVDVSRVRVDPTAPTGLLVRDSHGERPVEVLYFRAHSAGSRLSTQDIDADYVTDARVLHVSGITPVLSDDARAATEKAVAAAKAAGVTVTFDPNIRRRLATDERAVEVLAPIAAAADVVLAGDDECDLLSGGAGPRWFLDRGVRLVVVKLGAAGCWATDGTSTWRQEPVPVRAADPVGAGDAFAAGFLTGLLDADRPDAADPVECLRRGAALGAAVVQVVGDIEGLPRGRDTSEGDVRR